MAGLQAIQMNVSGLKFGSGCWQSYRRAGPAVPQCAGKKGGTAGKGLTRRAGKSNVGGGREGELGGKQWAAADTKGSSKGTKAVGGSQDEAEPKANQR